MPFLSEIMFFLKAIKSNVEGSHDNQNPMLMVISYEIYETRQRLINFIRKDHSCKIIYVSLVITALKKNFVICIMGKFGHYC